MRRFLSLVAICGAMLVFAAPGPAANEDAIKAAIERGAAALKRLPAEADAMNRGNHVGATALVGLTLLECGVPAKDAAVRLAATSVRQAGLELTHTYSLALAVCFLDRLGDGDTPLVQSMGVRLMQGQNAAGGWSYNCPLTGKPDRDRLQAYLLERESPGERASPSPGGKEKPALPKDLQALVDALNRGAAGPAVNGNGMGLGGGDNSNTQFAILGLWVARRHGVPSDKSLARAEMRFRGSQHGDGGWGYMAMSRGVRGMMSTPSMTCAGLLGLGLGYGVGNDAILRANATKPAGKKLALRDPAKDRQVRAALTALGTCVGSPTKQKPARGGPVMQKGYYFLFSVERVAVAYNLRTIGNKDWYGWGSEMLLNSQGDDGTWQGEHGAAVDTCFALLFLCRANLAKDLSATLKGVSDPGEVTLKSGGVGGEGLTNLGLKSDITLGDRPAQGGEMRHRDTEAARLGLDLVRLGPDQQRDALEQLKNGKGAAYTDALTAAIPQLTGAVRTKAREALAERLARMTAKTLRAKLQDDEPEVRRAAALACAMKDEKEHVPDLIAVLEDREAMVLRAAHAALKGLTGQDFGPAADATAEQRKQAVAAWKTWWKKQTKR